MEAAAPAYNVSECQCTQTVGSQARAARQTSELNTQTVWHIWRDDMLHILLIPTCLVPLDSVSFECQTEVSMCTKQPDKSQHTSYTLADMKNLNFSIQKFNILSYFRCMAQVLCSSHILFLET